jgi:membrane protein DedA with SNARE-associated domain
LDAGALLEQYGYAAVALGSLLEGETFVVLAGYAAHRGYLDLGVVIAIAAGGARLGDQAWFLAGRRYGPRLLARWPRLAGAVRVGTAQLERNAAWFVVTNRFMYGLRTAGPIAMGMSDLAWHRFAILNAIGALLWATVIAVVGYALGEALHRVLGELHHLEKWIVLGVLVVGAAAAVILKRRRTTSVPDGGANSGS